MASLTGNRMDLDARRSEINQITEEIIACVYRVSNTLGAGFEKVYENALAIELRKRGLSVVQQHPVKVFYADEQVGDFAADTLVEGAVIIELNSARALDEVHSAHVLIIKGDRPQDMSTGKFRQATR